MKKIIFILALSLGLMSFSTSKSTTAPKLTNSFLEIENTINDDGPCRWRFCTIEEGVKTCSEWEYGYCFPEILIKL